MPSKGYTNNTYCFAPGANHSDWRVVICIPEIVAFLLELNLLRGVHSVNCIVSSKPKDFMVAKDNHRTTTSSGNLDDEMFIGRKELYDFWGVMI
jgi:hypothetical protein